MWFDVIDRCPGSGLPVMESERVRTQRIRGEVGGSFPLPPSTITSFGRRSSPAIEVAFRLLFLVIVIPLAITAIASNEFGASSVRTWSGSCSGHCFEIWGGGFPRKTPAFRPAVWWVFSHAKSFLAHSDGNPKESNRYGGAIFRDRSPRVLPVFPR